MLVPLVIALAAALAGAILAVFLRQSVIVGYLIAGIAIGPYTPGFVGDVDTVESLAEIGVVFLMFAIGVQLSLRELIGLGRVAVVGALVQVAVVLGVATLAATSLLGWPPLEALFLGAVVSNSSSTVLGKVLGERDEVDTFHGRIALAWSSVQDLATVVLVVLLTGLAAGGEGSGSGLLRSLGMAAVLILLIGPACSLALPWVFERIARTGHRELFVVAIGVVSLGVAAASSWLGVSIALGAFVAGIAVGESDFSHRILGEVEPLRDIFAGLFFVSVGMLVDPKIVVSHPGAVALVVALIVVFKGGWIAVSCRLAGCSRAVSVLVGVGLAQCGEFAVLLARLGADLGAVPRAGFDVMVAATVASIVLLPGLLRLAEIAAPVLDRWLPPGMRGQVSALAGGAAAPPAGHAIVCGWGRVGQSVGETLARFGVALVVIDQDVRAVRTLRARGVPALLGDASAPSVLARANPRTARVLVVTFPDAIAARRIVDLARRLASDLDVVARTHSEAERRRLRALGATETVLGELELALEIARHTLRRFDVPRSEIDACIDGMRQA